MKKRLIILAHPDLANGSLANKIIVDTVKGLDDVSIRNLYELYPDFAVDIDAEQTALLEAEKIVFQFPFYWYSTPGIMKEWQDRVLTYGFAYGSEGDKLKGKAFVVSTTIGGSAESYGPDGYNTFSIETLLTPLEQLANLTGMVYHPPIYSHGMIYIPGVYNKEEEVVARANEHAARLKEWIRT